MYNFALLIFEKSSMIKKCKKQIALKKNKEREDCDMDTVINRLSDIEKAAVSVMDGASERKKQMAREMEEKTAAFDAQLEKENQDRISQIRSKMEEELQQELRQQSEDAKATMKRLEATYENRHEEYAQALFKNMIKE